MPEEGSYKATITLPSDRELVITRGAAETYDRLNELLPSLM